MGKNMTIALLCILVIILLFFNPIHFFQGRTHKTGVEHLLKDHEVVQELIQSDKNQMDNLTKLAPRFFQAETSEKTYLIYFEGTRKSPTYYVFEYLNGVTYTHGY